MNRSNVHANGSFDAGIAMPQREANLPLEAPQLRIRWGAVLSVGLGEAATRGGGRYCGSQRRDEQPRIIATGRIRQIAA